MRFIAVLMTMAALCVSAKAQTPDCKSITDHALRPACHDKANPPIATFPTPMPRPAPRPVSAAKVDNTGYVDSLDEDDARVDAQLRNICRGC
jgi:hypothetical protein